ncbi:thioredoxin [Ancylomarina euxinus]|uniref:Thioredoxin n=1 Tax=Ancylomarina euxinus TaxID=2283627 RepID=A0A425XZE5_9BACT|nr:thioredoxin family protein [Ancylomarina euxinus]MCZ4695605.1 thioredoxin family protein [Ancylomarina euxinus]MUP15986.1 thioredoxin fold domain-containing protein [Ancylomarina euxinus]RRG20428.1 thioredoxin [Ancylomarina euxinus]
MKKILIIVVSMFACGSLFSQGIEFKHGTFNEALAKAKKENKLLFMDCYTSWCGPCKYLSETIFSQKEVGDFFNKNFVSFKMDMEKGEGIELCKKYQVKSFPTLLFIDAKGSVVHKLVGGMPGEELIKGAQAALNPNLRIGTLREKFEGGNREYEFLLTYLTAVKRQYDKVNIPLVSKALIENYSLEKFLTKDLFYVISGANINYVSKEYRYLVQNKDVLINKVGAKECDAVLRKAIRTHLFQFAEECFSLTDLKKEIEKCKKDKVYLNIEDLERDLSYTYCFAHGQLKKWFDLKLQEAANLKGSPNYVYVMHNIGDEVVRNPKFKGSEESINRALKIGHELADNDDGVIMGNFLLAKLYLKVGNKEKAQKHYDLFIEINGEAGGNNTHPSVAKVKNAIDLL